MADNNEDLMAEFQEFLTQKREAEKANAQEEDFEIEIWTKDGDGVRTRRSHAKPFLQRLGIDVDPPAGSGDDSGQSGNGKTGDKNKTGRSSTGKTSNATGSQSITRKYFVKTPPAGTK